MHAGTNAQRMRQQQHERRPGAIRFDAGPAAADGPTALVGDGRWRSAPVPELPPRRPPRAAETDVIRRAQLLMIGETVVARGVRRRAAPCWDLVWGQPHSTSFWARHPAVPYWLITGDSYMRMKSGGATTWKTLWRARLWSPSGASNGPSTPRVSTSATRRRPLWVRSGRPDAAMKQHKHRYRRQANGATGWHLVRPEAPPCPEEPPRSLDHRSQRLFLLVGTAIMLRRRYRRRIESRGSARLRAPHGTGRARLPHGARQRGSNGVGADRQTSPADGSNVLTKTGFDIDQCDDSATARHQQPRAKSPQTPAFRSDHRGAESCRLAGE